MAYEVRGGVVYVNGRSTGVSESVYNSPYYGLTPEEQDAVPQAVASVTPDATAIATEQVQQAYRDVLGREAEQEGLEHWVEALTTSTNITAENLYESIANAAVNFDSTGYTGTVTQEEIDSSITNAYSWLNQQTATSTAMPIIPTQTIEATTTPAVDYTSMFAGLQSQLQTLQAQLLQPKSLSTTTITGTPVSTRGVTLAEEDLDRRRTIISSAYLGTSKLKTTNKKKHPITKGT